jgi:hypothetical protein
VIETSTIGYNNKNQIVFEYKSIKKLEIKIIIFWFFNTFLDYLTLNSLNIKGFRRTI